MGSPPPTVASPGAVAASPAGVAWLTVVGWPAAAESLPSQGWKTRRHKRVVICNGKSAVLWLTSQLSHFTGMIITQVHL